jgi:HEAT repeat protein
MDERYDMMRSVADARWLYIRNYRPDLPYVQPLEYQFRARGYQSWARVAREGKLTKATAQFWGSKPSEELYDMIADPDSVNNLADTQPNRATLDRMRKALVAHSIEIKDNGFLPEGSPLEGYNASHKSGAWPVEKVIALATLASERNPANLSKFVEALNDGSEPMRWWAAQGCTILGDKAAPAENALRKCLSDSSGSVQVVAAEALARMGKIGVALPVLERCLGDINSPWAGLQAANVLDRLGNEARPGLKFMNKHLNALPQEPEIPSDPFAYQRRILTHATSVLEGKTQGLTAAR